MIRRTTRETEMLLQARWRLGLSQHQVASLIGLADRQYQRYEYGEMAITPHQSARRPCAVRGAGDRPGEPGVRRE